MAEVYDRMPMILKREQWPQWTDGSPAEAFEQVQTWCDPLIIERTDQRWGAAETARLLWSGGRLMSWLVQRLTRLGQSCHFVLTACRLCTTDDQEGLAEGRSKCFAMDEALACCEKRWSEAIKVRKLVPTFASR